MKIRQQITGALCGLLDTYCSRYSDYDGYWMFGLLVGEAELFRFDLIRVGTDTDADTVVVAALRLARLKFQEQLQRAQIPIEYASEATLSIQKVGGPRVGPVNGHISQGHQLSLVADAVSDLGKKYRAERFLFVAPHDPRVESRSTRREVVRNPAEPLSPSRGEAS